MKIAFFEIEDWQKDYIQNQLKDNELWFSEEKLNKDNLPSENDFDAISVFVGSSVDKNVIDNFQNLKLITTRSTGFDHIDLDSSKEKNISVGYVPGYGDNTVAEFAFGLILNLSRKMYQGIDQVKETGSFSSDKLMGFDLKDKTIGIIGTGRIGRHMISIAKGFGMNVVAFDAFPNTKLEEELQFKYVSLDELLSQSDIVSLHVPYIESTHHLINLDNISKFKKGALLINTARGAVVDTEAIIKGINDGILSGAGLDVLEEEGVLQDEKSMILSGKIKEHNIETVLQNHVLLDMPNVLVTPHNAFNTKEAITRILNTDIQNIKDFSENKSPTFPTPEK